MAVCVYHKPGDFWKIPRQILSIYPGYRFAIRQHDHEVYSETVLYCIPPGKDEDVPDRNAERDYRRITAALKKLTILSDEEKRNWLQHGKDKKWFLYQLYCGKKKTDEDREQIRVLDESRQYLKKQEAVHVARIQELEGWTAELEKAKAYTEEQLTAKDARITELEGWTAELEKAKRYLEGQVNAKNARIDELESWSAELQKGKEYLEGQVAARAALITELESRIIETEKKRDKQKEPSLSSDADKVLPKNTQADQKEFISIPAENEKKKHGNGFDHIISLGYNCEVSFRIVEYLGGKTESFPLSWVYIKDQSNTVFILDHLSAITEAQRFPFVSQSGMFLVEELNIAVHSHVRPQHPGAPESAFLDEASKEIRSRFAHLNEKWKDVLAGNDSVLFLLKLQDWRGQEKCAELIKELNAWLSSEFKSGKYLLVCFTAQRENYEHICQDKVIQSLSKVRVNYIRFFAPDENTKDGGDRVSWLEAIDRWYHCSDSCD